MQTGLRGQSAVDALPAAVKKALVREVGGLVGHRGALGDVEAEIEIAQAPGAAQLELFEDREDARGPRFVGPLK